MPNSLELNVSPALLHTFAIHPFHVRKDMEMNELVDSIRESGVIVPLIVRSRNTAHTASAWMIFWRKPPAPTSRSFSLDIRNTLRKRPQCFQA